MKNLIIPFLFLASCGMLKAQDYNLDFAIPDMPAFKALGNNPSNILRPTDIKDMAAMLQPFYSDEGLTLPKNFALEFGFKNVLDQQLTLEDYNEKPLNRILYHSSFSIGTSGGNSTVDPRKLALGLRTTLLSDNADLRRAPESKAFMAAVDRINFFYDQMKNQWQDENGLDGPLIGADLQAYDDWWAANKKILIKEGTEDIIEEFEENQWNASRLDIAVAYSLLSADTTGESLRSEGLWFWATWASRPSRDNTHSQFLLGLTANFFNNDLLPSAGAFDDNNAITLNGRWYEGRNDFKGFLEYQFKHHMGLDQTMDLLNLGAEIKLKDQYWLVLSGGLQNSLIDADNFGTRFISSLDLRIAINQ